MPGNGKNSEAASFSHSRREHLKGLVGAGATLSGVRNIATESDGKGLLHPDDLSQGEDTNEVSLSEGTNIAVTASPDGETIIMDHAGILFSLPREGGEAEPLTDVELEPVHPDFSPDGNQVTFQGYADGTYDIYTMAPDGSNIQKITKEPYWDDREPEWSPDGSQIAFASDRGKGYDIWLVDIVSGEVEQLTDTAADNYLPTWSPDGSEIAYLTDGGSTIRATTVDGDTRTLFSADEGETFHAPSWGPDGDIAYIRISGSAGHHADLMISGSQVTEDEDVFVLTPDWLSSDKILYTADGKIRTVELDTDSTTEIPYTTSFEVPILDYEQKSYEFDQRDSKPVKGIQTPDLSPEGDRIAFIALNDLWVMEIGGQPRRITDNLYYKTAPAWSPDGRYIAYSSDEAGTQDIYIYDTETGASQQLTAVDGAAVKPDWSPEGSEIAFQNHTGAAFVVEVDINQGKVESGTIRQVADPVFTPGALTWSADGSTLAMAALNTFSARFGNGTNQIRTVDIQTGETNYYPPGGEFKSIATRNNDGPVWSPDGEWMAFVVESTLHVMPVTENGEPDGPATQITEEATDGPSWSSDSEWLLYLSNGQLKKVRRDGSETQEITLDLDFEREYPTERKLIYAGQMWDGVSPELYKDVTIEVEGNRISDITPDSEPPSGSYIDASDLTVIPGLWDVHNHQTYSEELFGARQGLVNLAFGVTTTVDRAAFVYHAVQDREALEAKERIAPRYFMTGELIDGSRSVFPTNRMTTSLEQIELEMSRAVELDYDFVKSYDRLNPRRMAAMEEYAHDDLGVPFGSHYIAPGAFVGQNGTTHLDVSHRFGFSRAESETGQVYNDVISLHSVDGEKKRGTHTTFFHNNFILFDEMENDPRLGLFPPWRREGLLSDLEGNSEYPTDSDGITDTYRDVQAFKKVIDNGGLVAAGTDVPLEYNGVSLHANLRPLVKYGFSTHEALLTATRYAAEQKGVEEDLGTLEKGKLADMVFVDGNPLEQIEDAMQVRMTMTDGQLFTLEDLLEPFSTNNSKEDTNTTSTPEDTTSTPAETSNDESTTREAEDTTTGSNGPGFGVLGGLAGIGGTAYLLQRRFEENENTEE